MRTPRPPFPRQACAITAALLLLVSLLPACSKQDSGDGIEATSPKKAASALENAFESAPTETQENVRLISDAMRQAEYEKAVVSLEAVRSQPNLSVEQGMAIHGSMVSMEQQLIQAIQRGDPDARRAYELLRALKRN